MSGFLGFGGSSVFKNKAFFSKSVLVSFFFLFLAATWAANASGDPGYVTKLSNAYTYGSGLSISPDGRFVSFPDDYGHRFNKDLETGIAEPARAVTFFSADNRYRAFTSDDSDIVPGDTNGVTDVFVEDAQTHVTTRVSTNSAGEQVAPPCSYCHSYDHPSISADGRFVAFPSVSTELVPGDTNSAQDVFVKDTQTGTTTRVSTTSAGLQVAPDCDTPNVMCGSSQPAISANGRFVAFTSDSSDLVPGDTNAIPDIFVKDLQTGATTRVSTASDGAQAAPDCGSHKCVSLSPAISADGRFIAFESNAGNLAPASDDHNLHVFLKDTQTGATTLISQDADGQTIVGEKPALNADARYVSFVADHWQYIVIKDLQTGHLDKMMVNWNGPVALSADGSRYIFGNWYSDNDLPEGPGVYLGATSACADTYGADMSLSISQSFWASYSDYANRRLSIRFNVANSSASPAYDLTITGFTTTDYANLSETLPVYTGTDVYPGGQGQFTLHYNLAPGISHFVTSLRAVGRNRCAADIVYPH